MGPVVALTAVSCLGFQAAEATPVETALPGQPTVPVIVSFPSGIVASTAVSSMLPRGTAEKVLGAVNGVAVTIPQQLVGMLQAAGAMVTPDEPVSFTSTPASASASCPANGSPSTPTGMFPQDTGANLLGAAGDSGAGTTVAVLDTGIDASLPDFGGRVIGGVDLTGGNSPFTDQYGHGTFVAGLIAGNGASSGGQYSGEAPGANLVSIKVAGASGATSISTVIQGIDWAIRNKSNYGIDVLNLSLGAIPTGPTATEPLDQAVEHAWRSGIAVVVAAGNSGPNPGTITSPGDDPLAITVGAYADNGSPSPANWYACPFSSVGPTLYDGWLKPDLTAPGRSVVSLLDPGSTIATQNPQAVVGIANFVGSGTSFSAAITSGAAALVFADNPSMDPNGLKAQLLGYALPSETQAPLIEGHGFLNAYLAATSPPLRIRQAPAAQAESSNPPSPINLGTTWQPSGWNPANWSTPTALTGGSTWNGSTWNGSTWNGSTWNGSTWNGSTWNGSTWNGSTWNGSSWTGSSWTGSTWNGSSWTGSSWTGSNWTGSSWTGSSWTGDAWS